MNSRDSSGFNIREIAESMELLRAERCVLLEFPDRDLRQWMIHVHGYLAGFVDRWGGGPFWALAGVAPKLASANLDEALAAVVPPTVAFARLEHAVTAVEFAKMVHDRCGVCEGMRQ
jgi:hypothetical protein